MIIKNTGVSPITYYYLDRTIILAYPSKFPPISSVSIDYIYYPNTEFSIDCTDNKNTFLGLVGFTANNADSFHWSVIDQKVTVSSGPN